MRARKLRESIHAFATHTPRCVAILTLLAFASAADAASYNVSATVNGTYQQIGTIDANYLNYGSANGRRAEEGVFQLNAQNKFLMNDACDCEFRWFQVVTQDTSPINYLGSPLPAKYADPPSNGWDYQRTPQNDWQNGQPGADTAPFYENDDSWPGVPQYPKYSGTLPVFGGNNNANAKIHDDTTGTLRTQDNPGTSNGDAVRFWTYLAYMNSTMKASKEFALLWGYSWGFSVAANGTFTYDAIAELNDSTLVDDLVQGDIINALGADGFSSWTPQFRNVNLICVPEPASALLVLVGCCALFLGRRKRV